MPRKQTESPAKRRSTRQSFGGDDLVEKKASPVSTDFKKRSTRSTGNVDISPPTKKSVAQSPSPAPVKRNRSQSGKREGPPPKTAKTKETPSSESKAEDTPATRSNRSRRGQESTPPSKTNTAVTTKSKTRRSSSVAAENTENSGEESTSLSAKKARSTRSTKNDNVKTSKNRKGKSASEEKDDSDEDDSEDNKKEEKESPRRGRRNQSIGQSARVKSSSTEKKGRGRKKRQDSSEESEDEESSEEEVKISPKDKGKQKVVKKPDTKAKSNVKGKAITPKKSDTNKNSKQIKSTKESVKSNNKSVSDKNIRDGKKDNEQEKNTKASGRSKQEETEQPKSGRRPEKKAQVTKSEESITPKEKSEKLLKTKDRTSVSKTPQSLNEETPKSRRSTRRDSSQKGDNTPIETLKLENSQTRKRKLEVETDSINKKSKTEENLKDVSEPASDIEEKNIESTSKPPTDISEEDEPMDISASVDEKVIKVKKEISLTDAEKLKTNNVELENSKELLHEKKDLKEDSKETDVKISSKVEKTNETEETESLDNKVTKNDTVISNEDSRDKIDEAESSKDLIVESKDSEVEFNDTKIEAASLLPKEKNENLDISNKESEIVSNVQTEILSSSVDKNSIINSEEKQLLSEQSISEKNTAEECLDDQSESSKLEQEVITEPQITKNPILVKENSIEEIVSVQEIKESLLEHDIKTLCEKEDVSKEDITSSNISEEKHTDSPLDISLEKCSDSLVPKPEEDSDVKNEETISHSEQIAKSLKIDEPVSDKANKLEKNAKLADTVIEEADNIVDEALDNKDEESIAEVSEDGGEKMEEDNARDSEKDKEISHKSLESEEFKVVAAEIEEYSSDKVEENVDETSNISESVKDVEISDEAGGGDASKEINEDKIKGAASSEMKDDEIVKETNNKTDENIADELESAAVELEEDSTKCVKDDEKIEEGSDEESDDKIEKDVACESNEDAADDSKDSNTEKAKDEFNKDISFLNPENSLEKSTENISIPHESETSNETQKDINEEKIVTEPEKEVLDVLDKDGCEDDDEDLEKESNESEKGIDIAVAENMVESQKDDSSDKKDIVDEETIHESERQIESLEDKVEKSEKSTIKFSDEHPQFNLGEKSAITEESLVSESEESSSIVLQETDNCKKNEELNRIQIEDKDSSDAHSEKEGLNLKEESDLEKSEVEISKIPDESTKEDSNLEIEESLDSKYENVHISEENKADDYLQTKTDIQPSVEKTDGSIQIAGLDSDLHPTETTTFTTTQEECHSSPIEVSYDEKTKKIQETYNEKSEKEQVHSEEREIKESNENSVIDETDSKVSGSYSVEPKEVDKNVSDQGTVSVENSTLKSEHDLSVETDITQIKESIGLEITERSLPQSEDSNFMDTEEIAVPDDEEMETEDNPIANIDESSAMEVDESSAMETEESSHIYTERSCLNKQESSLIKKKTENELIDSEKNSESNSSENREIDFPDSCSSQQLSSQSKESFEILNKEESILEFEKLSNEKLLTSEKENNLVHIESSSIPTEDLLECQKSGKIIESDVILKSEDLIQVSENSPVQNESKSAITTDNCIISDNIESSKNSVIHPDATTENTENIQKSPEKIPSEIIREDQKVLICEESIDSTSQKLSHQKDDCLQAEKTIESLENPISDKSPESEKFTSSTNTLEESCEKLPDCFEQKSEHQVPLETNTESKMSQNITFSVATAETPSGSKSFDETLDRSDIPKSGLELPTPIAETGESISKFGENPTDTNINGETETVKSSNEVIPKPHSEHSTEVNTHLNGDKETPQSVPEAGVVV